VLDTQGRQLFGPVNLSNGSNDISLASLPPGVAYVRVRFDFGGNGLATAYVKNWGVSYVSTHRAPVLRLQALGMDGGTRVTWTEPEYPGFDRTVVLRRTDAFPTSASDSSAMIVYDATSTPDAVRSFEETGFANGQTVFYAAYTSDGAGWSPPARTLAVVRPGLSGLTATGGAASVKLQWPTPATVTATYSGVTLVRRVDAFPEGPSDPLAGVAASNVVGTTYTDMGVTEGTHYRYGAFVHHVLPLDGIYYDAYSVPATATAAALWKPPAPFNAHGRNGSAVLSWTAPASGHPTVRVVRRIGAVPSGPYDSGATVVSSQVTSPGVTYSVAQTGLTNLKAYWYAAYTIAENAEHEEIVSPAAVAGCVPKPLLAGFKTTPGDTRVTLSWTKPSFTGFAGVRVLRRAGAYPAGPTDPLAKVVTAGSTGTSVADTGLTNLTKYYYRAYVVTRLTSGAYSYTDYSDPVSASAVPKYRVSLTLKPRSYKKHRSPYYYYLLGKRVYLYGTVSPRHGYFEGGAKGYVNVYVYKRRYSSRTKKYYWVKVTTLKRYMTNASSYSYWKGYYKPKSKGIYKAVATFPGDARHLSGVSATRYVKIY
jgi:hypothetical protein